MTRKFLAAYAAKMTQRDGRAATAAEAEAEVHAVVRAVARAASLSPANVFGYHAREDIEHEAVVLCLEAISDGRYDPTRPLANFLHVHVKNRLRNLKRNTFMRPEAPCSCCDAFNPGRHPCRKWHEWNRRNSAKQSLMRPVDASLAGEADPAAADPVADEASYNELVAAIDAALPAELRSDYLRMLAGVPLPKGRRQRVRDAILEAVDA